MKKNTTKMVIALPSKIESIFQIDSTLNKIQHKIQPSNYEFYMNMLLYKIKLSYCREYFMKQFELQLTRKKIKTKQSLFSQSLITDKGIAQGCISGRSIYQSSTSNIKKTKTMKKRNTYLYTPYKYFHIIYTGMVS